MPRHADFPQDDESPHAAAEADPAGFVAELPARATLDEVQRAPSPFAALELAVDRDRSPGRFLLTGSTNVLLVPPLADPLAGRIEILRLRPSAQSGIPGTAPTFPDALSGADVPPRARRRPDGPPARRDRPRRALPAQPTHPPQPPHAARAGVPRRGGGRPAGIEVKARATATAADEGDFRALGEAATERGEQVVPRPELDEATVGLFGQSFRAA